MPTIWFAILYFLIKSNYWKKLFIYLGFIFLFFPSLPIVSTSIDKFFYNDDYKVSKHKKKPSYILVPGAGATHDGRFPTLKSIKRAEYGKKLANRFSIPIIFSGGLDAFLLPKYINLEKNYYLTEVSSTNTFDMAKNLKTIIKVSDGPLLLATDPIHHKRTILTLKKQNFDVYIPNNYISNKKTNYSVIPSVHSINRFNEIIYETLGIIWYFFSGKI
jgi:uncharacterized SAM-binding protein YcdF (DUF218 family)